MLQRENVVGRRYAAAGYEVDMRIFGHYALVELRGGAGQSAVLAYLGAKHVAHAMLYVSAQEGQQVFLRVLLPAVDAHFAASHVGTKYQPFGTILVEPREKQLGLGHGDASHRHHSSSGAERFLDVGLGLDASAEVNHEVCGAGDGSQHMVVDHVARLGSVEVDHVKALEAESLELLGLCHRVFVVDGLAVVVALGEAHALAVDKVYGWYKFYHGHCRRSKKLRNMRSPTGPLFSGWNWQA